MLPFYDGLGNLLWRIVLIMNMKVMSISLWFSYTDIYKKASYGDDQTPMISRWDGEGDAKAGAMNHLVLKS